jgi:chaperone modulatory protein CbpM
MADPEVLDETAELSLTELCEICRVERVWVEELLAHGTITLRDEKLPATSILRVRKALRLERDLDLNMPGMALALDLLDEIERLRAELAQHQR